MFIYDAASIRVALAVLLFLELLQGFDPFLQFLHHAPQNHGELLIIESHELPSVQILRLAHRRAQLPAGLHVLGYEADLLLATIDALLKLRLHGVDGLLFHSVFLSYRICLPGRVESGVDESFACLPTSGRRSAEACGFCCSDCRRSGPNSPPLTARRKKRVTAQLGLPATSAYESFVGEIKQEHKQGL